jgi:hypothetical protein
MEEVLSGSNLNVDFKMIGQLPLLLIRRLDKRVMVMQEIRRWLKEPNKMEMEMQEECLRNLLPLRSWIQPRRLTCQGREGKGTNGTPWSGTELQRNSLGRDCLALMAALSSLNMSSGLSP